MKWAVLTLTRGALRMGENIKKIIPGVDLYTLPKWKCENARTIDGRLPDFLETIFYKYDILVFIMATGIVVRSIARYIKHKSIDPGILVMDEKGRFVISLLSGHMGGANDATDFLAKKIGAQPVITTASDVLDTMAVDILAEKLNCEIDDLSDARDITSLIVNGDRVGIVSSMEIKSPLPENIILCNGMIDQIPGDIEGIIYIDNKMKLNINKPKVWLIPRNVVIGIGCRKGVSKEQVIDAVEAALEELNIHRKSIKHFATADIKKNEKGLVNASSHYDRNLKIIPLEEIKNIENEILFSAFVKKSIGVGGVCEPCAYLSSSKNGRFLIKKTKFKGVAISLWEEKFL